MSFSIISTDQAPQAVGTYSQGAKVGNTFYFSGQIGIDPQTNQLKESFEDQLTQILKNVDALLESQNLSRKNIFKTSIFLTDLKQFDIVNKHYQEYFSAPFPARSCVEVSKLPKDALVEIEVMATE